MLCLQKRSILTVLVVGLLAAAGPTQAADDYFNGVNTSGDYATPSNWSLGTLPSPGGATIIASGNTATLLTDVHTSVPDLFCVGAAGSASGTGELDLNAGAYLLVGGDIRADNGATINIQNGGTLSLASGANFWIGYARGAAAVTVNNANLIAGNAVVVGGDPGLSS